MVETEESFTYAEFRDAFTKQWQLWRGRRIGQLTILGVLDDGSGSAAKLRFFWEDERGDRHFGVVSNLTSSLPSISFSKVTAGLSTGGGAWEIGNAAGGGSGSFIAPPGQPNPNLSGGFGFRKSAGTLRNAVYFLVGSGVFIGDALEELQLVGTDVQNSSIPWRNFNLDKETNVPNALAGRLRRNDAAFSYQGSLPDSGNTQRYKSFCQLWETGSIAGDGITTSFAITFTNAMKDAAYFVVFEYDDAGVDNPNNESLVAASKLNTGFTIDFGAIAPGALDTIRWYAVRYGI